MSVPVAGVPVHSIPEISLPQEPPRQSTSPTPVADAQPVDFLELSFAQPSCPDVQAMLVSPSLSVVSKKMELLKFQVMSPLVSSGRCCPPASGPPPCCISTTFIILV
jgi:hypothetical protein